MLKCSDGSYYVGHTDDVEKRLRQHQKGELLGYTYLRRPVTLVFVQSYPSRDEAFQVERRIKNWSRKKKEALIKGDWNQISVYAKKSFISRALVAILPHS